MIVKVEDGTMYITNVNQLNDYRIDNPVEIKDSQINNVESSDSVKVTSSIFKTIKAENAILRNSQVKTVISKGPIEIEDSTFYSLSSASDISVIDCSGKCIEGKNVKIDYTDPYNSYHDQFTSIKGDNVDLFRLDAKKVISDENVDIASSNIQNLDAKGNINLRYSTVKTLELLITTKIIVKLFRSTIKNLNITAYSHLNLKKRIQWDLDKDSKIEKINYK